MPPRLKPWLLWLATALSLAGCVAPPPAPAPPARLLLAPAPFADLGGWNTDRQSEAVAALLRSCERRLALSDEAAVGQGGIAGRVADWRAPCADAARLAPGDDAAARAFFEAWFRPYRCSNNGDAQGLFTGYDEPELRGARERRPPYETPLMKRPPDLVQVDLGDFRPDLKGERIAGKVVDGRLRPYATRAQIEAGELDSMHLALFWVDDPIEAFFLQIQGSGRVRLTDGSEVRVGYDGQNGWPYVAIGRVLVERHLLEQGKTDLPAIRAWLEAHPGEAKAILDANPSYVFFRELTGDGPIGAEGVVLTPRRSLAVDSKFLPLGAPLWLEIADIDGAPLRRLVISQDTGGAIRGPVRGDLFWGNGPEAEERAGTMRATGGYFLLLPKTVAVAPTISSGPSVLAFIR